MINFTPIPILFQLGPLKVFTHGTLIAIAFLLSSFLASKHFKNKDQFWNLIFFSFLGAIIGARLFYIIFYYQQFTSFLDIFKIWEGGLISYGGIFGGFITAYLYLKHKKLNFIKYTRRIIPYIALGLAIGRIGCFLNWDDYGIASNLPWAINVDFPRHPTQLYHSLANFITFFILRKSKNTLFLFILLYSIFRFIIDFFRDYSSKLFFLSHSQWLLIIIIITTLLILKFKKKNNISTKKEV
ncbi:prolipoprotein diacylglyceryl transferase [archaeon]|nr:prolipoprotein diacylglyceryl transferase [archaeon]